MMDMQTRIEKLKQLRGAHDQTMRCEAIKLLYGDKKEKSGTTPTQRFLEDIITRLEATEYLWQPRRALWTPARVDDPE